MCVRSQLFLLVGLEQTVAVPSVELEPVDLLQPFDRLHGRIVEGRLLLEGVQHDPFQEIPEREVEVLGQALQHLEEMGLDADSCLHTPYGYHATRVPRGSIPGCSATTHEPISFRM